MSVVRVPASGRPSVKSQGLHLALALSSALWGIQFVELRRPDPGPGSSLLVVSQVMTGDPNISWFTGPYQWFMRGDLGDPSFEKPPHDAPEKLVTATSSDTLIDFWAKIHVWMAKFSLRP